MKKLKDIIGTIKTRVSIGGEQFFSFLEFYSILEKEKEREIEIEDCTITPFYACNNRIMELYEFEFNIERVDEPDFKTFILRKTGRKNIEDVPKSIIALHKMCHVELPKEVHAIPKERILQYIDYLYENSDVKRQVQKVFGDFEKDKLVFEYY